MAVGVVVQQAVAEPQHLARTQGRRQRGPGLRLRPSGVAVGVQQALAGGDDRPLPVVIQRAAFQNEAMTVQRHARDHADLVRDRVVMLKLILPAPAIEAEGSGPRRTRPENRSGVAQPDIAEAPVDHLDIGDPGETGLSLLKGLRLADHQLDRLAARPGQGADKGLDLGLGRLEVFLPKLTVTRPAHPHRAVRRPFGRDGLVHG